jgi:hypothetical protein
VSLATLVIADRARIRGWATGSLKPGKKWVAATRVLKCGFRYTGEVIDPEDGLVWSWEKHQEEGP